MLPVLCVQWDQSPNARLQHCEKVKVVRPLNAKSRAASRVQSVFRDQNPKAWLLHYEKGPQCE